MSYYQSNQTQFADPLVDSVNKISQEAVNDIAMRRQIQPYIVNPLLENLFRYAHEIADRLRSEAVGQFIQPEVVRQLVLLYIAQLVPQLEKSLGGSQISIYPQQQQLQSPLISGGFDPQGRGNVQPAGGRYDYSTFSRNAQPSQLSTGLSYDQNTRPQSSFAKPEYAKPIAQVPSQNGPIVFVEANMPVRTYEYVKDPDATTLSMKAADGREMLDVKDQITITDDEQSVFIYTKALSYVPEPTLHHVIDHFVDTMRPSLGTKYIVELEYTRFILAEMSAATCGSIDLTPMDAINRANLPLDMPIQSVLASISDRNGNIMKMIEDIFLKEFNDRLKRYVRLRKTIGEWLTCPTIADVKTIGSIGKVDAGLPGLHKNYDETVFNCFRDAILSVVTDLTKIGYYDVKDIARHCFAAPNFAIREPNFCERDIKLDNADHLAKIANKYTAFANNGVLVITNFIPTDLEDDLKEGSMLINKTVNPIDSLITTVWNNSRPFHDWTKTFVMRDKGHEFVMKNGITLDGEPFIFADNVDLD